MATFVENNDWEGEEWYFYIPLEENKAEIEWLWDRLERCNEMMQDAFYFADDIELDEALIFEKHTKSGYMDEHNVLDGKLDIRTFKTMTDEELFDALYKGKIAEYMEWQEEDLEE